MDPWDKRPSDVTQLSDGEIIDRMGRLQVEKKRLDDLQRELGQHLLERGILPATPGTYFKATAVPASTQWTIDRAKLEEEFGQAWVLKRCKLKNVSAYVNITPLSAAIIELMKAAE